VARRKKRPFTIVRRHGKMDHLPADVQREVDNLLLEPQVSYQDIAGFLKEKGYGISTSCVSRYGRRFMEKVQRIRIAEEQARVLIAQGGSGELLIEEATSRLLAEKIMALLMEPKFDVTKLSSLVSDFTKLQSSSVRREKVKADLRKKLDRAFKGVEQQAPAMSKEEMLKKIREEVYGLV
jgi:hypothetical protein